jgi:hypothetical protein
VTVGRFVPSGRYSSAMKCFTYSGVSAGHWYDPSSTASMAC